MPFDAVTRHLLQEPMTPATRIFNDLVFEQHGLGLVDATAPLGSVTKVEALLAAASFVHIQASRPQAQH
jgi:hypothetical protein